MIYIVYIVVASLIIWLSILASRYIDMLDRTTRISGALLGGVLLSAVTSLPELFTSISAVTLLDRPGLCIGDILGSNLFNVAMLAFMVVVFAKTFARSRVSTSHLKVCGLLLAIYAVMALEWADILCVSIGWISLTSLIIPVFYAFGVRYMAQSGDAAPDDGEPVTLTPAQITVRFTLASLALVAFSILLTYITDDIAHRLNLNAGFAGALFLGVATSLPEVTSTVALFRMGNFNVAVGNIVGSNIFNMLVLCIADALYVGGGSIYDFSTFDVQKLLVFGLVATPLTAAMIALRSRGAKIAAAVLCILCYVAFLALPEGILNL